MGRRLCRQAGIPDGASTGYNGVGGFEHRPSAGSLRLRPISLFARGSLVVPGRGSARLLLADQAGARGTSFRVAVASELADKSIDGARSHQADLDDAVDKRLGRNRGGGRWHGNLRSR